MGDSISYSISPNLRFFINARDDVSLDLLSPHIASLAAVNKIDYVKCQPDEEFVGVRELNRYQLDYMCEKESGRAEISEDVWKRIDKIEKYAAKFSEYRIGNKLWISFEKHIGMLLAARLDIREALDAALASRLISSLSVAIKDKIGEEDQTLLESIEFIFGEENVDNSRAVINTMIFDSSEKASFGEPEQKAEDSEQTGAFKEESTEAEEDAFAPEQDAVEAAEVITEEPIDAEELSATEAEPEAARDTDEDGEREPDGEENEDAAVSEDTSSDEE